MQIRFSFVVMFQNTENATLRKSKIQCQDVLEMKTKLRSFFSVFTYSIHSVIWIFNRHFIKNKIACTQANPLTAHSEMVVFLSFVCQTGRHRFYYLDPRDEVRTSKNICND